MDFVIIGFLIFTIKLVIFELSVLLIVIVWHNTFVGK